MNGSCYLRRNALRSMPGNITTGGFVVTPQDTLDYIETVNRQVEDLHKDMTAGKNTVDQENYLQSFVAFYNKWNAFYSEHTTGLLGGWTSRLSGSTFDAAEAYQLELVQWRKGWKGAGGALTTPDPSMKITTTEAWKKVALYGGGAVVLLGVIGVAVSMARSSANAPNT